MTVMVGRVPENEKARQGMKLRPLFFLILAAACILPLLLFRIVDTAAPGPLAAVRPLSPWLQWATVVIAFGVKPLYMILSLLIALWLRRRRAPDLAALKWAMVFFFTGELFCAVNYLFFAEGSTLAEYLHMIGMAIAFGCTVLAAAEFADGRVVHFSAPDKNCSLLAACGKCYKSSDAACSLRVIFTVIVPCLILLCAMPLLVDIRFAFQKTVILGTPYSYSHPELYQWFETRYAPALAALFFTAALLTMLLSRERFWTAAKLFFACGSGFLSFGMFRLILLSLYRDNLAWFVIWEELTELMYIVSVGLFLLLFRKKPLLEGHHP